MSPDVSGVGLLQAEYWSSAVTLLGRLTLASVLWAGGSAFAADARIAVAANFRNTAEAIAARLEAESPHRYEVIAGATGKLANQILNGAPFDVFMAADQQRPDGNLRAVGQDDAALVADREDRPHEVLAVTHASGDAVHDDADWPRAACNDGRQGRAVVQGGP